MKKRILSLLLVLLMVVTLVPTAALAARGDNDIAYPVTGGNIYFDKSTGTITYCDSSVKEAIIPETIEGVGVSCIGSSAFYKCRRLTSVTIPNSVTSISNMAFDGCTSLTEFVVSKGSKSFSAVEGVLLNKEKTTLIKYPLGKTNTSYEILNSVTNIGDWAFCDCTSLASITIPNSVTSIGRSAFQNCTSLMSITIPDRVTSIGGSAFYGCSGLTSVTIPNSVATIAHNTFNGCKWLASVKIPDSVTSIGDSAFQGCKKLTGITIPNSITSIGIAAFYGCTSLTSIEIPNGVEIIDQRVFQDCTNLTSIEIPNSVTYIGWYAFGYCTSLTSITIPNHVRGVGSNAFEGCTGLTGIELPDSVKSIGQYAFQGCTALKNLTTPSQLREIGQSAFKDCTGLETLNIPSVETIDASAFSGCTALTSVSLPKNVKTIGNAAFRYCESIKDVYYAGSETEWSAIDIQPYNNPIVNATKHYAGETHTHNYVDGVCTICGAKDPNYVPPHTHDYNAVVTAPTCTGAGYTTFTCTTCGQSYKDNYTDALGHDYKNGECTRCHAKDPGQTHTHDYKSTVTRPTCTEKGYTTHTCSCGDSYKDSYKDVLGHLYIFGKCIRCGEKEDSSETHKHDYKSRVVDPTCTEGGYTLWECECGKSYETLHTKALGHEYKDGVCARCGAKDPNAHTHQYVETVTKSTCTEKGYTTYTCSVCGDSYKGSYTDALGHSYVGGICTRCGASDPNYKPPVSFVDVPETAYYYKSVQWAVENGITEGVGNNRFDPNGQCTRGQVVTFLWRAAGKPIVSENVSFSDVQPGAFYYEAVKWAVANGITQGVGGNRFAPNDTCTRGQVVTFLHRAANTPSASTISSFVDVPATAFYYNAVNWAVANGITTGVGGNRFAPNDTCTRAQVVTFLYRAQ